MPRLALLSMNPPILDDDYHRIASAVECGSLAYVTAKPPLRMLRDLPLFHRCVLSAGIWYAYESYLNTKTVQPVQSDADALNYATY